MDREVLRNKAKDQEAERMGESYVCILRNLDLSKRALRPTERF